LDDATLQTFGASLERCSGNPDFLSLFYELFLASSQKVRDKFADTDFGKQKAMLQASLGLMYRAAREEEAGPPVYLDDMARQHSASRLGIGAELYDLWLDKLLIAVKVCDFEWTPEVGAAWEKVMEVGIRYVCARYHG